MLVQFLFILFDECSNQYLLEGAKLDLDYSTNIEHSLKCKINSKFYGTCRKYWHLEFTAAAFRQV